MSLCINPGCSQPQNPDTIFCQNCGSELLLVGRYRVTRLLSQKGGFGDTYEVNHQGTAKVLKVLTSNLPKAVELFQQEAQVLKHLNHPGIPKGDDDFLFFPRNSQTALHCLVMEKIEGIDLEDYIQQRGNLPIDQQLALEWLGQLAKILHEVHREKFFHRDIKPSNIILRTDGQLVLIDFGAVRQVTGTIMGGGQNTRIYTLGYAPPEQERGYAVTQSDFFALGRTFVYLLTGKQPDDLAIYDPQNDELRWRVLVPQLSSHLGDFIDQLMARSANQRPADTQEILQRLEEINRLLLLYPPKIPKTVSSSPPKPVKVIAPPPLPPPPPPPPTTRRGFLKLAGFIGVGGASLLAVTLIREFFNNKPTEDKPSPSPVDNKSTEDKPSPNPIDNKSTEDKPSPNPVDNKPTEDKPSPNSVDNKPTEDKPSPNPVNNKSLQSFNFDVVTVNDRGKEITRTSKQAKFFSEDLGNRITLEMVAIPGGTFLMGSRNSTKMQFHSESPQHQVTVKPFFMGKFTITQAQWQAVAALPKVKTDLNPNPSFFKGADRPVEQVSWYDAEEFCARLSRKTGKAYRLPSEAEWEYACRGRTTTPFHFGETITPEIANYNGSSAYGAGPTGKYRQETTPVGSFGVANAFGLYDMHSNVYEWCADTWHGNYQGAPSDGSIWLSNDYNSESRVHRGCSWIDVPWACGSAGRNRSYPGGRSFTIGFRAVCSVV